MSELPFEFQTNIAGPSTLPEAAVLIGDGWYVGWGIADLIMTALGGAIYYLYPYNATSVTVR
jgi:hypothetical protein